MFRFQAAGRNIFQLAAVLISAQYSDIFSGIVLIIFYRYGMNNTLNIFL